MSRRREKFKIVQKAQHSVAGWLSSHSRTVRLRWQGGLLLRVGRTGRVPTAGEKEPKPPPRPSVVADRPHRLAPPQKPHHGRRDGQADSYKRHRVPQLRQRQWRLSWCCWSYHQRSSSRYTSCSLDMFKYTDMWWAVSTSCFWYQSGATTTTFASVASSPVASSPVTSPKLVKNMLINNLKTKIFFFLFEINRSTVLEL